MGLKCGIVGLPNVGKSTLFNALSNAKAEAANFPFCTIEPNVGVITVPDERLKILEGLVNPQKVLPTVIEFVDIAGLVKGASKGEGLGNKFLANIREVDAIVHVTRCFNDDNIVHVDGVVNPVNDKEVIDTELQLKDLESVDKKIQKNAKMAKSGDAKLKAEVVILEEYKALLESGKNARALELTEERKEAIADMQLLTVKPVIYAANVEESAILTGNEHVEALKAAVAEEDAQVVMVSAAITYFTAGETEVRAWTIKKGWKAPQAAGVIHTDFEKGFIKAEVVKIPDYQEYKTEQGCKEAGKLSIEGKEYVVEDGDVMHFRFNV